MNIANVERHVEITCQDNQTIYKVDNITIFVFTDDEPFENGWFGFRTILNHITIDNSRVYDLSED